MIREASLSDIPDLLAMGKSFALKAAPHVGFDEASVRGLLKGMIENPNGLVLVNGHSMFGAVIYAHPFNNTHKVAQELFWWSEGREGLALLKYAEEALKPRCDSMVMITLETVNPDRMAKLYQKMGFAPMERGFVKEF